MTHFSGVRFINVHLRRVVFRDVNLRNVIITGAHITGLTVDRFPITALIAPSGSDTRQPARAAPSLVRRQGKL
jgi:uncharacterized protein YjbI with pentapeptide repeats